MKEVGAVEVILVVGGILIFFLFTLATTFNPRLGESSLAQAVMSPGGHAEDLFLKGLRK